MVHLTRIYTRTGDRGSTRLADNTATSKTDARVTAYGDVDEANSAIGVVLAYQELEPELRSILRQIQNELFDVGADLATPVQPDSSRPALRIDQAAIDQLEHWCDHLGGQLSELASFVLPGGNQVAAHLHVCRTIVRRAERSSWLAAQTFGLHEPGQESKGGVSLLAITYLNRLSDLLFIMARYANRNGTEILWLPGGERRAAEAPTPRGLPSPQPADLTKDASSSSSAADSGQSINRRSPERGR